MTAHELSANGLRFNSCLLWVGLGKIPAWISGELQPVSVCSQYWAGCIHGLTQHKPVPTAPGTSLTRYMFLCKESGKEQANQGWTVTGHMKEVLLLLIFPPTHRTAGNGIHFLTCFQGRFPGSAPASIIKAKLSQNATCMSKCVGLVLFNLSATPAPNRQIRFSTVPAFGAVTHVNLLVYYSTYVENTDISIPGI